MLSAQQTASTLKELLKQQSNSRNEDAVRLDEIRRIFQKLAAIGELTAQADASTTPPETLKWSKFLLKQHDIFMKQLNERLVGDGEGDSNNKYVLRIYFGVLAYSHCLVPGMNSSCKSISSRLATELVQALCAGSSGNTKVLNEGLLDMLSLEFVNYQDVRYNLLQAVKAVANMNVGNKSRGTSDEEIVAENLIRLLMKLHINEVKQSDLLDQAQFLIPISTSEEDTVVSDTADDDPEESSNESESGDSVVSDSSDDDDDENEDKQPKKRQKITNVKRPGVQTLRLHRKALGEAWMSVLSLPNIPTRAHKQILQYLPDHVIHKMTNPLRLSDFMIHSYNVGGVTSVLALSGLFVLMTEYGLEYPNFYKSLYTLVQPEVMYSKYRARFFRLLTICLGSNQELPAYLVAAFIKRLCRSALASPPPAALFVIALVSNLLRQHRECSCLIHRKSSDKKMDDAFDAVTNDPTEARALESCLWEIQSFEKHYHPAVASLAKICGTVDTKSTTPYYVLEDFVEHSYKSLLDMETQEKRIKKFAESWLLPLKPPSGFIQTGEESNDLFGEILKFPQQ